MTWLRAITSLAMLLAISGCSLIAGIGRFEDLKEDEQMGGAPGDGDAVGGEPGDGDGMGGSDSGSGGSPDSGGAPGAGGDSPGSGGGGFGGNDGAGGNDGSGGSECVQAGTTDPVITDFFDESLDLPEVDGRSGTFTLYPSEETGTLLISTGTLEASHPSNSAFPSLSTQIAGGSCYDTSPANYGGISFELRSTVNASLLFSVGTPETTPTSDGGTCLSECYDHPKKILTVSNVMTPYCVPWSELAPGGWGQAPRAAFETAIMSLTWGVVEQTEAFAITLDNISFVASCSD